MLKTRGRDEVISLSKHLTGLLYIVMTRGDMCDTSDVDKVTVINCLKLLSASFL